MYWIGSNHIKNLPFIEQNIISNSIVNEQNAIKAKVLFEHHKWRDMKTVKYFLKNESVRKHLRFAIFS